MSAHVGDQCPICPKYLSPTPVLYADSRNMPEGMFRLVCSECKSGSWGLVYADDLQPIEGDSNER